MLRFRLEIGIDLLRRHGFACATAHEQIGLLIYVENEAFRVAYDDGHGKKLKGNDMSNATEQQQTLSEIEQAAKIASKPAATTALAARLSPPMAKRTVRPVPFSLSAAIIGCAPGGGCRAP